VARFSQSGLQERDSRPCQPSAALPEIDHLTMPRVGAGVIAPVVINLLCEGSAKACGGVTGRVTCRKTTVLFGVSTGRRMDLSPSFMWYLCKTCSRVVERP
jgi:hypothetical protein